MDIGGTLKSLRLARNLTQEDLADRCELTKGFISQVENNLTSPSIATLSDLIECLGSSLEEFFSARQQERVVFGKDDMFEKVDEEILKGSILWLVPDAQKNMMEPMLVRLGPGGRTAEIPAHDGEEFAYVLSGEIHLILGEACHRVGREESFCLHPRAPHHIENRGRREARFLWTSSPPSF
ncbi:MAG: cupin domain-containing protein [Eubacteriales bacterium]|nr:cupin domain-containing protein [Eubacteriales bacterium]